ncbi:hypothetical protein ACFLSJ_01310 [Verrucomicrobiota bacterium]
MISTVGLAASDYYVTPTGAGVKDGSDWGNAYDSIQSAIDASTLTGDRIYLRVGVYTNSSQLSIASKPGLTILGGYLGTGGLPGDRSDTDASEVTRDMAVNMRIVNASSSTFTLDGLTVRNGYINTTYGGGLYLSGCTVTITNCVIRDNQLPWASPQNGGGGGIYSASTTLNIHNSILTNNFARHNRNGYGGGIRTSGGALTLKHTTVAKNWLQVSISGGQGSSYSHGGAVYASGTTFLVDDCVFASCYAFNYAHYTAQAYGGAIYASGGSADILNTRFNGCYVQAHSDWQAAYSSGGAVYSANVNPLVLTNCTLEACYSRTVADGWGYAPNGGVLYVINDPGTARTVTMTGCEVVNNGSSYNSESRFINNDGTTYLRNNLFASNSSSGLTPFRGAFEIVNCTFADNTGWGLDMDTGGYSYPYVTVSNCIAWGNSSGGIEAQADLTVDYTCSQEVHAGTDNITSDPLFARGYYLSHDFVHDQAADSPCIDVGGDNAADIGLGALTTRTDGQTDSGVVDFGYHYPEGADVPEPYIRNIGDAQTSSSDAWVVGYVTGTGTTETTVYLYWGEDDYLRDKGQWTESNLNARSVGLVSNKLENLDSDKTYWFRFYATNVADEGWAEPSLSFKTLAGGGRPSINNDGGESNVTHYGAVLNGYLSDTGGVPTHVWVFWGMSDGETNKSHWSNTNAFPDARGLGIVYTNMAGRFVDGTKYYCTFYASNSFGGGWAEPSEWFVTPVDYDVRGAYVTPAGGGLANGRDWDNAFSNVQDAIDVATNAGLRIYCKHGTYTLDAPLLVEDKANLTIGGGYVGSGSPGATGPDQTVWTQSGSNIRILTADASTSTVERVTVAGGRVDTSGAGLYLTSCSMTLSNCVIHNNQVSSSGDHGGGIYSADSVLTVLDSVVSNNLAGAGDSRGGGLYQSGGTLTVEETTFVLNRAYRNDGGADNYALQGGGLYASGAAASVRDCVFADNRVAGYGRYNNKGWGGALYLTGGSAELSGCTFDGNYAGLTSWGNNGEEAKGGAVYAVNQSVLQVDDCAFSNCYAEGSEGTEQGGVIYLQPSGSTDLRGCTVLHNTGGSGVGEIYVAGGTVGVTNSLVADGVSHGIVAAGGTLTMVNCTLADNGGWGLEYSGGSVAVKNAIASGNASGGIEAHANVTVSHTCSQEAHLGTGNTSADPLFVDAAGGDYHIKSFGGSWHNDVAGFVKDSQNSPCIDRGDPNDPQPVDLVEPDPNGNRVNMGAYGNTAQASKSAGRTLFMLR